MTLGNIYTDVDLRAFLSKFLLTSPVPINLKVNSWSWEDSLYDFKDIYCKAFIHKVKNFTFNRCDDCSLDSQDMDKISYSESISTMSPKQIRCLDTIYSSLIESRSLQKLVINGVEQSIQN